MSSLKKDVLQIAVFVDGRPGHEKQSMGIVQGLQKYVDTNLISFSVERDSFLQRLGNLCRFFFFSPLTSFQDLSHCDLLLGTGSSTHPLLLAYKKKYSIPAVTCMTPNFYYKKSFDLCFVPAHDKSANDNNIIETIGAPNCSIDKHGHKEKQGMILLGGVDAKSHNWNCGDIVSMVKAITEREDAMQWTISSSPRTPESTVAQVKKITQNKENLHFFSYKDTPRGWIEEQYDTCSKVWVTSDSVSMIYEALSAGCSVGLLPVQWLKDNKFKANEELLKQKGLVIDFHLWNQEKVQWATAVTLNEAQRCANIILKKWWPEILQ